MTRKLWIWVVVAAALVLGPSAARAIDADGDGMSDVWQRRYGVTSAQAGQDFNGTGRTNVQKSIAGLDPRDTKSVLALKPAAIAPGQIMFTWDSVRGKRYRLESSADAQTWTDFTPDFPPYPDGSFLGTGSPISTMVFPSETKKFFRVKVLPSFDTDNDSLDDYEEFLLGTNPYSADTDGDGLTDIQEFQGFMVNGMRVYTDPTNPDSDGDGVADGAEVASGKNPMDPSDGFPLSPEQRPVRLRMQFRGTWPDYTTSNPPPIPALLLSAGSGASLDQSVVNTSLAVPNNSYFGNTGTTFPDRSLTRGVEYPFTLSFAGNPPFWPTVVGRVWGSPLNAAADRANLIVYQAGKGYFFTNDSGGIWSEAAYSTTGNGSISSVPEQQLEARNFNTGRLWAVTFDLDIDSLNARGSQLPLRSLAEEDAEETQAKRVPINLDDDNGNGIPDAQETQVAGEKSLIPVILEVAPQSLEWDKIKVKINSDATATEINLWRMDRPSDAKTPDRKIVPGTVYTAAQLGLGAALPGGGKQTQLKFFIEGLALTNGNRYLEAVFIFNNTVEREYFKDRVLFTVVPEVEIVFDPGASSRPGTVDDVEGVGSMVISNRRSSGEKHFVSPKSAGGFVVFKTDIVPAGTNFDDLYKWDQTTGVAVAGDPAARKVPRDATGKFTLRVLRKSDDSEADRINVWVVWASGTITQGGQVERIRSGSANLLMVDGTRSAGAAAVNMTTPVLIKFSISPVSIFNKTDDIPDLTGTNDINPPVPGGNLTAPGPPGNLALIGGVNSKWDSSRRLSFVVSNPSNIPRAKFPNDLKFLIPGNPPNGVQTPFPATRLIGNDDPILDDEDSNPYDAYSAIPILAHAVGEVTSSDRPSIGMTEAGASEGDVIGMDFLAQEFVRLQLGTSWYVISDAVPWKLLLRLRYENGQFIDTGSGYFPGN